ncbi:MAG: hypothetical protein A2020_02230 [Lentisphaerae bacterium GWF2_45_14]|nr:MAG: hypothetical protein A2020_02230 [Lentisphaerae bacterium GWF2_45_14]
MFAFQELYKKISEPPILAEKDQFFIKLAESEGEIEKALRLRYKIFNLEQGKGLESANDFGIDRDEFDKYCMHLIVVEKKTGEVVGTYRIHFGQIASSAIGFYSAREFEIKGIELIANESIEVGRSCVSPKYRTGSVVALLWRGINELLLRSKMNYLFGCVSLETTSPADGWALYEYFKKNNGISNLLYSFPSEKFMLPRCTDNEIREVMADEKRISDIIPPLFKGYLRLGTKICGEPAFDNEFGTIDFFIILNLHEIPQRYSKHFNTEGQK